MESGAAFEPVVYRDPVGVDVTLSEERWHHIVGGHPEMSPHRTDLGLTIEQPEAIYERGQDRYYFRGVMSERFGSMFLHARAMPKPKYFIVTAWLMPRIQVPKGAVQIWPSQLP